MRRPYESPVPRICLCSALHVVLGEQLLDFMIFSFPFFWHSSKRGKVGSLEPLAELYFKASYGVGIVTSIFQNDPGHLHLILKHLKFRSYSRVRPCSSGLKYFTAHPNDNLK